MSHAKNIRNDRIWHWVYATCLAVALCLMQSSPVVIYAEAIRGSERVDFVEITPGTQQAIDRGLVFLASIQAEDGSWSLGDRDMPNVGITALACMAFMSEGSLPDRGPYATQVRRGLNFILQNATESGLLVATTSHGPMYGHGFATLMLGEIYGMTGDPRVRDVLIKAVRLIVQSQNHEGGWRYQPIPLDADVSVTICQVMALRSARNAGISVPRETIDRAIEYIRRCQNTDGGFRYMATPGSSGFARTAAGVATLFYAGIYQDEAIEQGIAYMNRSNGGLNEGHFFYGQYYAAQAMYLAGGEDWAQWYPLVRDNLVRRQDSSGRWSGGHGSAYCTAMSLLVLQVPNRLLPIFQR